MSRQHTAGAPAPLCRGPCPAFTFYHSTKVSLSSFFPQKIKKKNSVGAHRPIGTCYTSLSHKRNEYRRQFDQKAAKLPKPCPQPSSHHSIPCLAALKTIHATAASRCAHHSVASKIHVKLFPETWMSLFFLYTALHCPRSLHYP